MGEEQEERSQGERKKVAAEKEPRNTNSREGGGGGRGQGGAGGRSGKGLDRVMEAVNGEEGWVQQRRRRVTEEERKLPRKCFHPLLIPALTGERGTAPQASPQAIQPQGVPWQEPQGLWCERTGLHEDQG